MHVCMRFLSASMLLIASTVLAQTPDEGAISNLLHATFDRPEAQLTIAPIVVVGNSAVAGWVQGEMGGRALLRKKGGQSWALMLCAGDGIKAHEALVKAGISSDDAATLERELAIAEGELPPEQVAMLSRFEGILMMDNSGNHPAVEHQSHAKH
jgi:hypothetical protein